MRKMTADPLGRYYTKPQIAHLLVSMMGDIFPRRIVDVGAGSGTLSIAAGGRWTGSEICTVDIDEACATGLSANLSKIGLSSHTHFTLDALDVDLPLRIKGREIGFDVSISNPPYLRRVWSQGFEKILEDAGLDKIYSAPCDVDIDILYIAQLLRLTKTGGVVGLIVPDGVITGLRHYRFRQMLTSQFDVECVIQLPRNSFAKTEAQAFILIMRNMKPEKVSISVMKYGAIGGLSQPIFLSPSQAEERMDYTYYQSENLTTGSDVICLDDIGAIINRGKINSSEVKASHVQIFHTSDFPQETGAELYFRGTISNGEGQPSNQVLAEVGDILIARVDRNLHRKVALVVSGQMPISDCVYRVRVSEELRPAVLAALCSGEGTAALQRATRGVGAKMLNKHDLLRLPLWPLVPQT